MVRLGESVQLLLAVFADRRRWQMHGLLDQLRLALDDGQVRLAAFDRIGWLAVHLAIWSMVDLIVDSATDLAVHLIGYLSGDPVGDLIVSLIALRATLRVVSLALDRAGLPTDLLVNHLVDLVSLADLIDLRIAVMAGWLADRWLVKLRV